MSSIHVLSMSMSKEQFNVWVLSPLMPLVLSLIFVGSFRVLIVTSLKRASFNYQICVVLILSSNMIICLRGSLGFGEEALQSLPGKIGSQVLITYLVLLYLQSSYIFFK